MSLQGLTLLKEHMERSKEVKTSQIQDRASRASLQGLDLFHTLWIKNKDWLSSG